MNLQNLQMDETEQGNEEAFGYHDPDAKTPSFSPRGGMNQVIGRERPMGGSSVGFKRALKANLFSVLQFRGLLR
jgi:hypothetical protein